MFPIIKKMKCRNVVSSPGKLKTPDGEVVYTIGETIYVNKDMSVRMVRGIQETSNTVVAIKELPFMEYRSHQEVKVFEKASTLEGVIPLLECLQDGHYLYLVMPYMEKGDLFSLVENTEISEDQARTYLCQMASTLLRLKQTFGLAHHDVSLENFMINQEGNLLLIDFGICIHEDHKEQDPYLYCGKPCYIPPELAYRKKSPDIYASDVWSLGICFYSMLTSMMLYDKPASPEFKALGMGELHCILKQDKKISPGARWLLSRMLHQDPRHRPLLEDIPMLSCKENNHVRWDFRLFNKNNKTKNQNYKTCVLI